MNHTEIFRQFENLNVLIIGDVMLDRYQTGQVTRISPEAPVPVVEWKSEENRLGGAANVALNIKALGATPYLCGVVGQDAESSCFFDLLPESGLDESGIVTSNERITTVKTRVIAGNQHLLRLDKEQTFDLSAGESGKLLSRITGLLDTKDFQVIILQDYNKGVLSKTVIHQIIGEGKKRRIPIAVDPKFRNFWEYREVELFKPNLKEVKDALRIPVPQEAQTLRQASELIRQKLNNHLTLITLSDKGVWLGDGTDGMLYPTHPRTVADVCGAGDTVISIAALALALDLPVEQMALLANLAGGQVVEKVGVVPVDKEQLKQELAERVLKSG